MRGRAEISFYSVIYGRVMRARFVLCRVYKECRRKSVYVGFYMRACVCVCMDILTYDLIKILGEGEREMRFRR